MISASSLSSLTMFPLWVLLPLPAAREAEACCCRPSGLGAACSRCTGPGMRQSVAEEAAWRRKSPVEPHSLLWGRTPSRPHAPAAARPRPPARPAPVQCHATDTYAQFAEQNEAVLRAIPPPLVALNYYKSGGSALKIIGIKKRKKNTGFRIPVIWVLLGCQGGPLVQAGWWVLACCLG